MKHYRKKDVAGSAVCKAVGQRWGRGRSCNSFRKCASGTTRLPSSRLLSSNSPISIANCSGFFVFGSRSLAEWAFMFFGPPLGNAIQGLQILCHRCALGQSHRCDHCSVKFNIFAKRNEGCVQHISDPQGKLFADSGITDFVFGHALHLFQDCRTQLHL